MHLILIGKCADHRLCLIQFDRKHCAFSKIACCVHNLKLIGMLPALDGIVIIYAACTTGKTAYFYIRVSVNAYQQSSHAHAVISFKRDPVLCIRPARGQGHAILQYRLVGRCLVLPVSI